jgi:hypothetical protein
VLTAHPFRLAKKMNSDSAKLNMQKNADAKKSPTIKPSTGIGKNAKFGATLGDDHWLMMINRGLSSK